MTPDEPNITAASEAEFGDFAGFIAIVFRRVTDKQIPSRLVCRYPASYQTPAHVARRVLHLIAHRDFDDHLARLDDARLRAMGLEPAPRDLNDPSDNGPAVLRGACHVHPGLPPHPVH